MKEVWTGTELREQYHSIMQSIYHIYGGQENYNLYVSGTPDTQLNFQNPKHRFTTSFLQPLP